MDALKLVLTVDILRDLELQDGTQVSTFSQRKRARRADGDLHGSVTLLAGGVDYLPSGIESFEAPLLGPNPLLETKSEFLQRAQVAWNDAVADFAAQGMSAIVPRKLELHCEWLVRYRLLGQTAAQIVKDLEETDTSTVHKVVKPMADMLDLPIRSRTRDLN